MGCLRLPPHKRVQHAKDFRARFLWGLQAPEFNWVAVEELNLSYHNMGTYIHIYIVNKMVSELR